MVTDVEMGAMHGLQDLCQHKLVQDILEAATDMLGDLDYEKYYNGSDEFRNEFLQKYADKINDVVRDAMTNDELPKQNVFMLCEEIEGESGIREFYVHEVSEDKDSLRKLLRAKVEQDEYGIIGENGVDTDEADHFLSKCDNDQFVEFYILEKDVKTREQTLALLQSPDYDMEFRYPDNLRVILLKGIQEFAKEHNYGAVDTQRVADDLLIDQQYRAELKQAWWFNSFALSDVKADFALKHCIGFLSEKLIEFPEYLRAVGAIPEFNPPDNLMDIMIDSIYDAAKRYHLPVTEPAMQAEWIMRHSSFRDLIRKGFPETSHLQEGSREYLHAATICMNFARYYHMEQKVKGVDDPKMSLADQIKGAEGRNGQTGPEVPAPEINPQR